MGGGKLKNSQACDRFQILSLDGGGIKGIFSAAVLAFLEKDHGINIADHFDLIVGTSTGGIIALGLGLGLDPKEIINLYVQNGSNIFPIRRSGTVRHFFRSKHKPEPLEKVLKNCFKEKRLGDSNKRLVIPAYNLGEDDVYLFKTPHHERLKRDFKVPVWQVAMATAAAPTFFPTFTEVDNIRLVDGGVWANNPIMVGIIEAVSLLDKSLSSLRVLSLGTTDALVDRSTKLDRGGIWQWKKDAIDVVLRAQSIGAYTQALHLLLKGQSLRIDPKVPNGLFALDKLSAKELLSKAAHESRKYSNDFKNIFLDYQASEYKPYHQLGEVVVRGK